MPTTPPRSSDKESKKKPPVKTLVTFPIVDSLGNLITEERRKGDRRHWSGKAQFPLQDSAGTAVIKNRRRRVERRVYRTEVVEDPRGARLPKILLDTGEALYELTCDGEVLTLGRDPVCDLVIEANWISRKHARIIRNGERFTLQDTSTNGTFVRPEGDREHHVTKDSIELGERGIIRLGQPLEDGSKELIRYTVITSL